MKMQENAIYTVLISELITHRMGLKADRAQKKKEWKSTENI